MKKKFGDYYLGLDVGTDSVGWAVTDTQYKLMKVNGKALWGIRLFDNAETAASRRMFRTTRRRLARRKERIGVLQELFADEIYKVDASFFLRMKESKYWLEDKVLGTPDSLFSDPGYSDQDYHKEFPTVYHLRKALIEGGKSYDVRLLYLAVHHILKHRGHFLFYGQGLSQLSDFDTIFKTMSDYLIEYLSIDFEGVDANSVSLVLKDRTYGITQKKDALRKLLPNKTKQQKEIITLLSGGKGKLSILFDNDSYKETENDSISFSSGKWDDEWDTLQKVLSDNRVVLESMKAAFDWGLLAEILNGQQYLSFSKVQIHEKHKSDLKKLRNLIKKVAPDRYEEVFYDSRKSLNNYVAYIGKIVPPNKAVLESRCTQEELCEYLENILRNAELCIIEYEEVYASIKNGTFLPKQVSKDNSVIPYQLHQMELVKILDNAASYLDFLNDKDSQGLAVKEKILQLFEFRIPYYVGPLNPAHKIDGFAWVHRKEKGKVYPWNFERKVDLEKSAERFIVRMTNKCTYLAQADVLPRNSILYSKFTVLDELNNLLIGGEPISVELKQRIFNDLFLKKKKITHKQLAMYLRTENVINTSFDVEISGIDGDFKSSMASYIDMKNVLGEKVQNVEMVEDIIRCIVLFGDDKRMLETSIRNLWPKEVTNEELRNLCKLRYQGWGRLSKEFLCDVTAPDKMTGEYRSILTAMWEDENNPNHMQLLSAQYGYLKAIEEYNRELKAPSNLLNYEHINQLYLSPSVKRMLWQTMLIVKELRKIMGRDPLKVFIEMARGPQEKKRTISRKDSLRALYRACKDEGKDWIKNLDDRDEREFRRDRLYLYYTQMGRCLYSGESIDIDKISDKHFYEVDHIFPQSKIKDDSLDNRVLVKTECNAEKGDIYPLKNEWRRQQGPYWKLLLERGMISKKKYERLTRDTSLSDNELAAFIERQLVETRQTSKAAAQILSEALRSQIVYVKASNVSDFRQKFDLIKVRSVNDLHHAQDAYLNIVVGNVYHTKFTSNPFNYIKNENGKYNLKRMFDYDVVRGNIEAWKAGAAGTIVQVKRVMSQNNMLFTRYAYEKKGGFYNQTVEKRSANLIPLKTSDKRLSDTSKYGGYSQVQGAYFALVSSNGGKTISLESVPVYLAKSIKNCSELQNYFETQDMDEPNILIERVKINALLEIDGSRLHLSGRTGNYLSIKHAEQLYLAKDKQSYIKQLERYANYCAQRNMKVGELQIDKYDYITPESNIALYDILVDKLKRTPYSKFYGKQAKLLETKRDKFAQIGPAKQCVVLLEMLYLFQCNAVLSDLTLLEGGKLVGRLTKNKYLNKLKGDVYLIHQSVTGVFEKKERISGP